MASCVHTELMNIGHCWSADTSVYMHRRLQESIANEFILVSPAVPGRLICLIWMVCEMKGG